MYLKYLCNYIVLINIVYRDRCDEVVVKISVCLAIHSELLVAKCFKVDNVTGQQRSDYREGACLKIVVNNYKADPARLMEISKSRGTNLQVLLTSYNAV